MPDISKLVFFRPLSSSFRFLSQIRVGESLGSLSSRQWINKHCPDGLLHTNEHWEASSIDLKYEEEDWSSDVRFYQAITARELHYNCRTEGDLDAAITKALALSDGTPYHDIEQALEEYRENWDVKVWVDAQRSRMVTMQVEEILTSYYVISVSHPVNSFHEFLNNPIRGEQTAQRLSSLLNKAYQEETGDTEPVFFYIRLGDLPAAIQTDDAQYKIIDWMADKMLVPRGYTTVKKCEVLAANSHVAETWLARAKVLLG